MTAQQAYLSPASLATRSRKRMRELVEFVGTAQQAKTPSPQSTQQVLDATVGYARLSLDNEARMRGMENVIVTNNLLSMRDFAKRTIQAESATWHVQRPRESALMISTAIMGYAETSLALTKVNPLTMDLPATHATMQDHKFVMYGMMSASKMATPDDKQLLQHMKVAHAALTRAHHGVEEAYQRFYAPQPPANSSAGTPGTPTVV